jgi:ABC-2 type transport system ATP-binding protein
MPPAMIELDSLTKRYGDFTAVDSISLTVSRGEIFGFLGPNGAGKTTTIRILVGLSTQTSGRARVDGLDIPRDIQKVKERIGYVPDRPFLYEKLTARELFEFHLDLRKLRLRDHEQRIRELVERFELGEWLDTRIESYSHGMKQKAVLVTALAHDPPILVIDEPMVGLDAFAQKRVRTLFREEAARGKTIFLTTHTLSVAEAVCDRIGILHRGRLAALGTLDELRASASAGDSDLEDLFLRIAHPDEDGL